MDVNIQLKLENDVIYLKMVLPDILKRHGKGLKSLNLVRKDKLQYRSEKSREMTKEAALEIVNNKANEIE